MKDEIRSIIPVSKSGIKQNEKRKWFNLKDDTGCNYTCFDHYLYSVFKPGEAIMVRVTKSNRPVILAVTDRFINYPELKSKPPINRAEAELFTLMDTNGWELTKKGWPDFACFKDGELILIEVKPKRSHRLKHWQRKIMTELVKRGIKCYRWSPDAGFEPIIGNIKSPIDLP